MDTATRWAIVTLIIGQATAVAAAAFLDLVVERLAGRGVAIRRVLSDRGGEFTGHDFIARLEAVDIDHVLIRPGHPTTIRPVHRSGPAPGAL